MSRKRRTQPGPYLLHAELLRDTVPNWDKYPFALPAVRTLDRLAFHPKVTFLVGENGSGKSTLLEALAVALGLNPEGGSANFNFTTRASHSQLDQHLRVARTLSTPGDRYFLRAESFYNVASDIERMDRIQSKAPPIIESYGGRSLHEQSHGESFFALFQHRFGDHGLYFMDEPEAALSPTRQLQFLVLLHDYCRRGGQFVIATHSPIIMAYPDARILAFGPAGVREVPYKDTEHYAVTWGFLRNPDRMLRELIGDGPE